MYICETIGKLCVVSHLADLCVIRIFIYAANLNLR